MLRQLPARRGRTAISVLSSSFVSSLALPAATSPFGDNTCQPEQRQDRMLDAHDDARVDPGGIRVFGFVYISWAADATNRSGKRRKRAHQAVLRDVSQRPNEAGRPFARILRSVGRSPARAGSREDDPEASRRDDAAVRRAASGGARAPCAGRG